MRKQKYFFFVPMSKNLNSCGKRQSVVKSRLKDLKSNFLFCSVLFCSQLNDLFYPEDRKGVTDKFPLKDDCSLFTTSYVKHSCNLPSLTSPLIAFSHIRMNILLSMFQSKEYLVHQVPATIPESMNHEFFLQKNI